MFRVNNKDTKLLLLTLNTSISDVLVSLLFIANFENISQLALVFLLWTLSR